MRHRKAILAFEFNGEWLKVAQVIAGRKGGRLVKLAARRVSREEELADMLLELVKEGMSATGSVLISIPRNLVTVRNLQLPTTDHHELKEMVNLEAAKQTPYSKDEVIADFRIVSSSADGYTEVVLVTTHRSVPNRCLNVLDGTHLKAEGVRLSSEGVLSTYRVLRDVGADKGEAIGLLDIDYNVCEFMVVLNGEMAFSRTLAIGSAKLVDGDEKDFGKFAEEIRRAIEIYENEGVGGKIAKVVITGAEPEFVTWTRSLAAKVGVPVEKMSLRSDLRAAGGTVDLVEPDRVFLSFAGVLGLAWNPAGARMDLTPQEARVKDALAQKGRAIVLTGVLVTCSLTALTGLISQQMYFKKAYLERLDGEVRQTGAGAAEVEELGKKMKVLREMTGLENSALEILSVVHRTMPSAIYLKSIRFDEGSGVVLKGISRKMSTVFEFRSVLEKQPNFGRVKTKHVVRSSGKGGTEETEFEITCAFSKKDEV